MAATLDNADNTNRAAGQRAAGDSAVDDAAARQAAFADERHMVSERPPDAAIAEEPATSETDDADVQIVSVPSDRHPRYCRRCQESLSFFVSAPWRCWKCGLEFDPRDAGTVLLRRTPLKWKFWFPGYCMAMVLGMLVYALMLSARAPLAAALIAAAPTSFGCLLGYGADGRTRLIGLGLFLVAVWGLTLLVAGYMGVCVGIAMLIPVGIGMVFGLVLRALLENSNWDQRWYFP